MIDRVGSALRVNFFWLVGCIVAVSMTTLWSTSDINSVTGNLLFSVGAMIAAATLLRSAWISRPAYDSVKYFVYALAGLLVVLALESAARGIVVVVDLSTVFQKYVSAPLNLIKLSVLAALLVVNASMQYRTRHEGLAKLLAWGIGLSAIVYAALFFVVRALLS